MTVTISTCKDARKVLILLFMLIPVLLTFLDLLVLVAYNMSKFWMIAEVS
jgi:hypothetical protein